jgi:DNA-binding transcriptional regulator YiaG
MNMEMRYGDSATREPLHYNWCGLDYVYLLSGYERVQTEDGEDIIIQDIDGLHRAIGLDLVQHKKVLTGSEVRFLRKQMDLTQSELGYLMATTDQTVARWEKGECEMPGPADTLLRFVYLAHIKQNVDMRAFIEELRERDAPINEKMMFTETAHGWKAAA